MHFSIAQELSIPNIAAVGQVWWLAEWSNLSWKSTIIRNTQVVAKAMLKRAFGGEDLAVSLKEHWSETTKWFRLINYILQTVTAINIFTLCSL